MHPLDWLLIAGTIGIAIAIGLAFSRRASRDMTEYFAGGRALPWWVLGTSMVATTFASDTPLVVSGLVVGKGIAANWIWWNFLIGGMLTVYFFSRLWRRSEVLTEIELLSIRYGGRAARILRGFKAVYLGLFINAIVFGWVTNAAVRVIGIVLGIRAGVAVAVLMAATFVYTFSGGLWGVVATDVLQFALALTGAILVAVLGVREVGGLGALLAKVREIDAGGAISTLSLYPRWDGALAFLASMGGVWLLVNWWAVYYPGAEPGGGGFIAQRMLAARNERHALAGTLWFNIAHYAIRPWPWIIAGLVALALDPSLRNAGVEQGVREGAYALLMRRVLPPGLLGLTLAGFAAAYMSTINSLLNLSASYLVNDVYRPFLRPDASSREYVWASRITVAIVLGVGAFVSWILAGAGQGWQLVMELTAGIGPVLLLRWYWWRVSAWSEIAALAGSCASFWCVRTFLAPNVTFMDRDAFQLLAVVGATTAIWLAVTFLMPPEPHDILDRFEAKVRPGGWWGPVLARAGRAAPRTGVAAKLVAWGASVVLVYGLLFGVGELLLGSALRGGVFLAVSALAGATVARAIAKMSS
ncbi:MAG: Na+:solute symporter [Planctomycetes bacterium]|nr:Na+:solute symporter [Planctomycetota bacterium]